MRKGLIILSCILEVLGCRGAAILAVDLRLEVVRGRSKRVQMRVSLRAREDDISRASVVHELGNCHGGLRLPFCGLFARWDLRAVLHLVGLFLYARDLLNWLLDPLAGVALGP